jgi:hypothetical protein
MGYFEHEIIFWWYVKAILEIFPQYKFTKLTLTFLIFRVNPLTPLLPEKDVEFII